MKYNNLYPPLVQRINHESANVKSPEKAAKTRLHQLYGAYISPNSNKKAKAIIEKLSSQADGLKSGSTDGISENINQLLKLHASTHERLPYYIDFYKYIFDKTGPVSTVLDLGCGYNPFSLPYYPCKINKYHAIDIDMQTRDLLNAYFDLIGLPKLAYCADLALYNPKMDVDLTLMLKLFPVLCQASPDRAAGLANGLCTKWLVITFPTKSLGGRKKGMYENYRESFFVALNKNTLENFTLISENQVGSELVFILRRQYQRMKTSAV